MFIHSSCFGVYWKELPLLRNYLPDSDSYFNITIAPTLIACISFCSMTDGCHLISYTTTTAVCTRHYQLIGYKPQNYTSVWNTMRDDGCPGGWKIFGSSCFLFTDFLITWQDAMTYCHVQNAELVEVDTRSKDAYLRKVAKTMPDLKKIWTSGSEDTIDGSWRWMTSGSLLNYTNWKRGQPDGTGGPPGTSHCMCLTQWSKFLWDDNSCNSIGSPVCEKSTNE